MASPAFRLYLMDRRPPAYPAAEAMACRNAYRLRATTFALSRHRVATRPTAAFASSPAWAETALTPERARYCVIEVGGLPGRDWFSYVSNINDRGQVLGLTGVTEGLHVFLWDRHDGTVDFTASTNAGNAIATRINDRGDIVGTASDESGPHAILWDARLRMQDLNESIDRTAPETQSVRLYSGNAINNAGWIAAVGNDGHDATIQRSYVLIPKMRRGSGSSACR